MKIIPLSDSEKPSFCWDRDWTIGEIRRRLSSSAEPERLRLIAWILREATFQEVWNLLSPQDVFIRLKDLLPWLGRRKDYWRYTFDVWHRLGKV